ncbi:MAG: hypothetical protein GWP61_04835 [Chloroflexi bacterium]|nr:hypothetical protein [Chloroflexota bacterium]
MGLPLIYWPGSFSSSPNRQFLFLEGPIRKMAVALSLKLFIVILSGTGRGETGRIYLFFAPFSLLIAIDVTTRLNKIDQWILLFTQLFWFLIVLIVLRTVGTGLSPPRDLASVRYPAAEFPVRSATFDFDNALQLQGYSGHVQTDPPRLILDLYWQPNRSLEIPYFLSAVVIAKDRSKRTIIYLDATVLQ